MGRSDFCDASGLAPRPLPFFPAAFSSSHLQAVTTQGGNHDAGELIGAAAVLARKKLGAAAFQPSGTAHILSRTCNPPVATIVLQPGYALPASGETTATTPCGAGCGRCLRSQVSSLANQRHRQDTWNEGVVLGEARARRLAGCRVFATPQRVRGTFPTTTRHNQFCNAIQHMAGNLALPHSGASR